MGKRDADGNATQYEHGSDVRRDAIRAVNSWRASHEHNKETEYECWPSLERCEERLESHTEW